MPFSELYRVAALSLFAIVHCLSSSFTADGGITAPAFDVSLELLVQVAVINGSMKVATRKKSVLFMSSLLSGRCAWDPRHTRQVAVKVAVFLVSVDSDVKRFSHSHLVAA